MLTPLFTGHFKRQRKLMIKRGKDINKLTQVMGIIIREESLPPERCNHPIHGKWKGCLESHVEPDWLLIYEIDLKAREVTFHRTGSHSDVY
jgi:mRNA interferase YafQ